MRDSLLLPYFLILLGTFGNFYFVLIGKMTGGAMHFLLMLIRGYCLKLKVP